jgi:hypothetical protein
MSEVWPCLAAHLATLFCVGPGAMTSSCRRQFSTSFFSSPTPQAIYLLDSGVDDLLALVLKFKVL